MNFSLTVYMRINKFKEFIEEYYTESVKLELKFQKENIQIDAFSDEVSIFSESNKFSELVQSVSSRLIEYSNPIMIQKVFTKDPKYVAKYYYIYPDFPNQVMIRCAIRQNNENLYKYEWKYSDNLLGFLFDPSLEDKAKTQIKYFILHYIVNHNVDDLSKAISKK